MRPPLVPVTSFHFAFVGHGASAAHVRPQTDQLWLDVGNELRPGVIDHHHLPAYLGTTAQLVIEHADLVADAVQPKRRPADPFTITLHREPDLDALMAAYVARAFLSTGELPKGLEPLLDFVERVDTGYPGLSLERPYTVYAGWMVLLHRCRSLPGSEQERWARCVADGLRLIEHVLTEMERIGVDADEVDAFTCPGLFGPQDRAVVDSDRERYRRKLASPACHAQVVKMYLPVRMERRRALVDGLLIRHVQSIADPERVLFFKDWARTDAQRSPASGGFDALSVYEEATSTEKRRCILSVTPQSNTSLQGLGAWLDRAEGEARAKLFGVDNRKIDPQTGQSLPPRSGYDNSDPWYDGRGHGYTIVDAPRGGTVLEAEQIEEIFLKFGRGEVQVSETLARPSETGGGQREILQQMGLAEMAWRREHGTAEIPVSDVFISYPPRWKTWVLENIYEPLSTWRGKERIFLDQHDVEAGSGWIARLASQIERCRVFLPLYCPEFFESDLCQWELQRAIRRDPCGSRRIVIPFLIRPVTLPAYCSLIPYEQPTAEEFRDRLLEVLRTVLG